MRRSGVYTAGLSLYLIQFFLLCVVTTVTAFDFVPKEEEILKYRRSWTPLSNGPNFMPFVEVQPKGQFDVQPFMFGQVGEKRFGNTPTTDLSSPTHLYQNSLVVTSTYGLTDHVTVGMSLTGLSHWTRNSTRPDGPVRTDTGPADTSLGCRIDPLCRSSNTEQPGTAAV